MHQFMLDDETYYALMRLTEAHNNKQSAHFYLADDMLKELVLERHNAETPPKSILEKIRDGEEI